MIIGVAGSFVGGILFWFIGLSATGVIGNLIVATVGAVAFLFFPESRQIVTTAGNARFWFLSPSCFEEGAMASKLFDLSGRVGRWSPADRRGWARQWPRDSPRPAPMS